jgi:hypothetical protein
MEWSWPEAAERCIPDGPESFITRYTEGIELAKNEMLPMVLGWPVASHQVLPMTP